jgi:hypothetical protein
MKGHTVKLTINKDLIDSFNKAVTNADNIDSKGSIIWDFVSADVHMDLGDKYNFTYIDNSMDVLIDRHIAA